MEKDIDSQACNSEYESSEMLKVSKKPYSFFKRAKELYKRLGSISSTVVKALIFLLVMLVIISTIYEIRDDRPIFDLFEVPGKLEDQGYSGKIIAHHLLDQMNAVRKEIFKSASHRSSDSNDKQNISKLYLQKDSLDDPLEIKVPGLGLSLNTFIHRMMSILGLDPGRIHVDGDIVVRDKLYLTVRISGKPTRIFHSDKDDPEKAIRKAAYHILYTLEPQWTGLTYYSKRDRLNLKSLIQHIKDNNPSKKERVIALVLSGCLESLNKNYAQAAEMFSNAGKIDPKNVEARYLYGEILEKMGEHEAALRQFQKALELDPGNPEIYIQWIDNLINREKFDQAEKKYQEALQKLQDKPKARIYTHRGNFENRVKKKPEKAIEQYKNALSVYPGYAQAYLSWGEVLWSLKRKGEALEKYREALRADPQSLEVIRTLASALMGLDLEEAGFNCYAQAAKSDPNNYSIYIDWASFLFAKARYKESIEICKKGWELSPMNSDLCQIWGLSLVWLNKKEESSKKFDQCLELGPINEIAFAFIINSLIHKNRSEEAINLFKKNALLLQDSASRFSLLLRLISSNPLKPEELSKIFDTAVKLFPDYAKIYRLWGERLKERENFEEALVKFDRAVELAPDNASSYYYRGQVLEKLESYEKAVLSYEKAAVLNPENYGKKAEKRIKSLKQHL